METSVRTINLNFESKSIVLIETNFGYNSMPTVIPIKIKIEAMRLSIKNSFF
jgi:hypothetical protein